MSADALVPADPKMEPMRRYWRREHVLASFVDAPALWHLRIILSASADGRCNTVLTPDRDVYDIDLHGGRYLGVFRWPTSALPDPSLKKAMLYTDKQSANGPVDSEGLEILLAKFDGRNQSGALWPHAAEQKVRLKRKQPRFPVRCPHHSGLTVPSSALWGRTLPTQRRMLRDTVFVSTTQ